MALKSLAMTASLICVHIDNIAPQFQPGRVPASFPCGCGTIPPQYISDAGLPENMQRKLTELPFSATVDLKLLYIILTSTALIGRGVTFTNLKFLVIVTFHSRLYRLHFYKRLFWFSSTLTKAKQRSPSSPKLILELKVIGIKLLTVVELTVPNMYVTLGTLCVHTAHA
jgi:hypothetical protein